MKYVSRKYVDLIHAASSKWANWDPPHPIKVGDYGTIDKDTGGFEKEGNIYEYAATAALAANYPPETTAPDDEMVIASETAQKRHFSLGPQVNVSGVAEASIKGEWKFRSGKTGALLVMAKPRSSLMAVNAVLTNLVDLPALKDKYLVTETITCHAYSMYLSNKSEDTISLALLATVPIAVAPLSAGGNIGGGWWRETGAGVFRQGFASPETGADSFTPLFVLKRIRKKSYLSLSHRGMPSDPSDAEIEGDGFYVWEDVETPWQSLDEDGEEETFDAGVSG
ncbi:hypothetical protein DFH07DRAFT_314285 [Mycena maculata]|uniref:Uncharacterized protein n=1 Tax=Mycena maculata TaxID=230809 RepID=A0AAD7HG90_9AGAR|nr:hypothetical protein DFH07DRAFT_314285 [Mycena maculata]